MPSPLTIPLQPVASPTNQFTAPAIQQPDNSSANNLGQLSQALAQIKPELSSVFQQQFQAYTEGSVARANEDYQQNKYDNTKALKQAVDDGHIAEADNPWYMVQLKQDVASNEASEAARQMQANWETSPVRESDDPKAVEKWAQDQMAPVLANRDAYESEAMAPVVQQGITGLVNYHMDVRRQERQEDRVANLQTRLSNILMAPDQTQAPSQLNQVISDARLTMPGSQVNGLVVEAAMQSAQATGSDDIFKTLSTIPNTGAGGTLADLPQVKKLQAELPLMRLRRDTEAEEFQQRQDKIAQQQRKESLLSTLMTASGNQPEKVLITPDLAKQAGITFDDMIDVNDKAARYGQTIQTATDKQNDKTAQNIQGQAEADIITGRLKITDPQVQDARARVATLSPEHLHQFDQMIYDQNLLNGKESSAFATSTDPQTYADLWKASTAGTLTMDQLIPQAGKLNHEDWTRLAMETVKPPTATKVSDFPMSLYNDQLKNQIAFPKISDGLTAEDAAKDPATAESIINAQTKLAETTQSYLNDPTFNKLPRDQQTALLHKARDNISEEFGGVTDDQRQAYVAKQAEKAEAVTKSAQAAQAGGATFENGTITTGDGQTVSIPTSLTDVARGQIRSVSQALRTQSGDTTRSLEDLYNYPNLGSKPSILTSDWTGPNSLWNNWSPPAIRSTVEAQTLSFIHNSRLLNKGSYYAEPPMTVVTDKTGTHTQFGDRWNVQQSAIADYKIQRDDLAVVRRNLEQDWITPANHDELMSLTSDLQGKLAAGQQVPQEQAERFQELQNKFRLYDFLGATAGVNKDDIVKDYSVLYKYPAASSVADLAELGPVISKVAPPAEYDKIVKAQLLLISNAQNLLQSGRFVP